MREKKMMQFEMNQVGDFKKALEALEVKEANIMLDIINRMDVDSKKTRKVRVDLQDLLEAHYEGRVCEKNDRKTFNQAEYDDCLERLIRLADFRAVDYSKETKNGQRNIFFRTLLSGLSTFKSEEQTYVDIFVSEELLDDVSREEIIKILNKKIQESEE